ncbi:DUF2752 domain-containing protein [Flavobacterium columnare]|uniref:DUF2752 domain-containing protein n=2 Tax=Flavobacterium columnare TaxID=996 RepID=G8X631_FLACA|nr:hypothetical protein FCOL_07210 [Flavobacterium columnare ATCC 49512]MBF6652805.1 DUF2752 domain-containing protein [Flavobacterium columnare]MBF6655754.1 DUF2752 domain-containing protein [Flavobacterium columnare]MBF6658608.1 DUF2752 domain-containing protein [Flavobacterium columnare]PTD15004.1 DUF2752 domain-containing protein [Flavobacterium columnare]
MNDFMIPCLFKMVFRVDCLGCGAQRAFILLLKGELKNAFFMYPPLFSVLPYVLLIIGQYFKVLNFSNKYIRSLGYINLIIMFISYFIKHLT